MSLVVPDVAMGFSCCSGSSYSCTAQICGPSCLPGPQAACPLQETEDTIAERKRARDWERDCTRVRAPVHGEQQSSLWVTQQCVIKGIMAGQPWAGGMMSLWDHVGDGPFS